MQVQSFNYNYYYKIAVSGSDYMSISSNQTFTTGSSNGTTRCVYVNILDDFSLEENQSFHTILTTEASNLILQQNVTVITVIDNDGKF